MAEYEYRHRELYRGVSIDIKAHTREDMQDKVNHKKYLVDASLKSDISNAPPVRIGDIGEYVGMASFTKAGFVISKPLTVNSKYDFIADYCGALYRVQVKTTSHDKPDGSMHFSLRSSSLPSDGSSPFAYTKRDVDLFYLYCVETEWEGIYYPGDEEYVRRSLTVKNNPDSNGPFTARCLDFQNQIKKLTGKFCGKSKT